MPFRDLDGDGFDDVTGATPGEYAAAQGAQRPRTPGSGVQNPDGSSPYYDASTANQPEYVDPRDPNVRRAQRDADAGAETNIWSYRPNNASDSQLGVSGLSEFDQSSADTFLWGDITGATGRAADYRRRRAEAEKQAYWDAAERFTPSADDLWVQYEEEGLIDGPSHSELGGARADRGSIEAQQQALRLLQDVANSGGMTAADRARQQLARQQTGQAVRAARDADMSALQARGMGGSGANLASMLSAQQAGANSLANQDAQMLIDAQQRALQAMQMQGSLSGQMRGQSFDEEATRRSAIDDFNRYQTDYLRDRERANNQYRNRTRESRAESRQQAYTNRERLAAGRTGQYAPTKDPSDAAAESNARTGGFLGGLLNSLTSL